MNNRYAKGRLAIGIGALLVVGLLGTYRLRATPDTVEEAFTSIQPQAIRADMRFLADDLLEGRLTGSRGHEVAAKFVAAQFEAMGLEPAGENGTYFQNVPLRSMRVEEEHSGLSLARSGQMQALSFGRDFISLVDPGRTDSHVQASVVYVGFGVTAPDQGYDDYAGVDTKGKIVAYLFGAPPQFEATMRAHYSSRAVKEANAAAHGAVARIGIDSPTLEQVYSFKDQARDLQFPKMRWLGPQGQPNDYFSELQGAVQLSMEGTAKLFEESGKSTADIYATAKDGKPLSFALPVAAQIKTVSKFEDIHSPNVVARLRGSDPELRDQYVVYTAHLDHMGIGQPVNGDKIYNGALDNAAGSACLLEIARAFSHMRPPPRRSILFVSVTGEEEGLLGSDYFAHYPTVPKDGLVADINMDGAPLLWPMEDLVAIGAEHSTIDLAVREAASRMKIGLSPDPHPEAVLFVRSDQYSFVKQGIPSVFPFPGVKSSDPKMKPDEILIRWFATIYHTPQDDMTQTFDFESGANFARYGALVGYLVAQQNAKPSWKPRDFFGEQYGMKKQ